MAADFHWAMTADLLLALDGLENVEFVGVA
jgi:hypothetical protein